MAIIHSPLAATVIFGGFAVMTGCAMVTMVRAQWRGDRNFPEFWKTIGFQTVLIIGCLTVWAATIREYSLKLPPDHDCASEYDLDGHLIKPWSLFPRACY